MDCSQFENLLDSLCSGTAPDDVQEAAGAHVRKCALCARLLRIAGGLEEMPEFSAGSEFASSVLELTSGPVCGRAVQLMSEADDAPLGAEQTRMLQVHKQHCTPCRRFAEALKMAGELLPTMREIDPGPGFTTAVLNATRRSVRRRRPENSAGSLWERLVRRPLFAWEAAYAATVLFAVIFLNPLLPVGQSSSRVLAGIQGRAATVANAAPSGFVSVRASIQELSGQATSAIGAKSLSIAGTLDHSVLEPLRENLHRWTTRPSK
jgi:hypothetical protein